MLICKHHPNMIQGYKANYCYECGNKLDQMPGCKYCGFPVDIVLHKYCPMCGNKVEADKWLDEK